MNAAREPAIALHTEPAHQRPQRRIPPSRADVLAFPVFKGLELSQIRVPSTKEQLDAAWEDLRAHASLGFDTESKPTFVAGEVSSGPDVVQFATRTHAYVFQLRHRACEDVVRRVLTTASAVKVGFGLASDQAALKRRLGVTAHPVLDLDTVFSREGYTKTLGIKSAVAVVFQQRLMKSKHTTTSNWAARELKPRQLVYAANDAYVALCVMLALGLEKGIRLK